VRVEHQRDADGDENRTHQKYETDSQKKSHSALTIPGHFFGGEVGEFRIAVA
jgi:hypothetical protein